MANTQIMTKMIQNIGIMLITSQFGQFKTQSNQKDTIIPYQLHYSWKEPSIWGFRGLKCPYLG